MDMATLIPSGLAVLLAAVAANLHHRLPQAFWLAVLLTCLISTLTVPALVYGIAPDSMYLIAPSGDRASTGTAMKILLGYGFVFGLLIAFFIGWLMRIAHAARDQ